MNKLTNLGQQGFQGTAIAEGLEIGESTNGLHENRNKAVYTLLMPP